MGVTPARPTTCAAAMTVMIWMGLLPGVPAAGVRLRAQQPAPPDASPATAPARVGLGRPATAAEIAAWDTDVGPDGTGLPQGRATAADGALIYSARCAVCHGKTGTEGPNDRLVGREPGDFPFARDPAASRTVGNYWPYATTLFDYIRRAMPPENPGSLENREVYGLVAFLLAANGIIQPETIIDARSLPKVVMPARDRFVPDPRTSPSSSTPRGR